MLFLTFGQSDFTFDAALQEMQIQGHQRVSGAFNLADQLADFGRIEQQFARAHLVGMNMGGCREQWADMRAEQKYLAIAHDYVGFLELRSACPNGFDFPSFQYDARLEALLDEVVVEGFFIIGNSHEMVEVGGSVKLQFCDSIKRFNQWR